MKFTKFAVLASIACGLALGQETEGVTSRSDAGAIKAQIRNLDSDSFDARTKAMDELRAAGEAARSELEAARKSPSLETRSRAETLLKELDDKKAPGEKPAGALRGRPRAGVRPLAPDDEPTGEPKPSDRAANVPQREDYPDPQAYVEALRKWMEKDNRFPNWVLPDGTLDRSFTVIRPDMVQGMTGNSVSIEHVDGETRTFSSGPDGVTLKVERRDDAGKPTVESWSAKSVEELKEKHPDVWEKYHPANGGMTGQTWTLRRGFDANPRNQVVVPSMPLPPALDDNQPKLGVIPSAVPPVLDKQLKLNGEGMVIDSVYPGSLAARLGIQELDVLVRLDGEVVRDRADIGRVLGRRSPAATVTARVIREGAPVDLSTPREKAK
jgi:hypothetical protein